MSSFEDKVIAITGAASGIGLATAIHFLTNGALISIADANQSGLHQALFDLEKACPGSSEHILPTVLDVRNTAAVTAWMTHTIEKFGRLDGAANLAGVIGTSTLNGRTIKNIDDQDWDFVLGVNLTGVKNCVRSELQVMRDGGSIVNAASSVGLVGFPKSAAYAVSKAGVISLTKTAAKEEGARGIRVNAIAPGAIDTPMLKAVEAVVNDGQDVDGVIKGVPLARKGRAEEVAKVIAFLLSEDSSYVTGHVQLIDGGLVA